MLRQHIYSDLDLRFSKIPGTNDVSLSYDEQSVIRSVKNLILTKPYERLFNPALGSNINNLLFELCSPITGSMIKDEIIRIISNWEPRVKMVNVNVTANPDQYSYNISLLFTIGVSTSVTSVNLVLKRSR